MANADQKTAGLDAEELVAATESGARNAAGLAGKIIIGLGFVWALFQIYIASNFPFTLSELTGLKLIFNNQDSRQFHLAFAIALAMLAFPLFKGSARDHVPVYDWIFAIVGAACCLYMFFNKDAIAVRAGLPTTTDLIVSAVGMAMLAIAVFRALGLPLVIVAAVFVLYVFFGHSSILPDAIQWKGASFGKALWHFWMQSEGVFGVALGVSASMIFLFVLFGALLERAGAGNYFIKLAFALLGHLRGGPAKAAVMASAMSGLYSGSSIANVLTTGSFTIPLMKRTGFTAEKAGAVEVASSTNGQLTPPVMGAAAFLIAEFTGVAYPELLKHAFLPAIISYIALVYIVHLEAVKLGLKGMERPSQTMTLAQKLMGVLAGFIGMAVLAGIVYYGLGWIKTAFPGLTFLSACAIFAIAYLILIRFAAARPDLTVDDPNAPMTVLPRPGEVAITGLYYFLPIVILIWNILIERLSPTLSAYWATIAMIVIVFTQNPLKSLFRGQTNFGAGFAAGWDDFFEGMIAGSRNMISIGVATGAAGVIVGTVSLTGMHQVIGSFVEFLSGGNVMIMLILVAIMSLILGMGLPTTANYIVVSSLMAPVIVSVGAQSGLIVPLVAVHLFVFYFGILADDTPPVGLAAYAAAAISRGDPIKTGVQGFTYDIRTALLPFLFIFNTDLLLIDVSPLKAVFIFIIAVIAMMLFAAATQGFFLVRSKLWETLALLLVAFTLFRPGFWLDYVQPPFEQINGTEIERLASEAPDGGTMRVKIQGPDFQDSEITREQTLILDLGETSDGAARLEQQGLVVNVDGDVAAVDEPFPGTPLMDELQDFDFYGDNPVKVAAIEVESERMPKEVFYIPALILLALVVMLQRRRRPETVDAGVATAQA